MPNPRHPSPWREEPPPRQFPTTTMARNVPEGNASQGAIAGSPPPHTGTHSVCATDPDCLPKGRTTRGGRAGNRRRHSQRHQASPQGRPPASPTARNASLQERTLWVR